MCSNASENVIYRAFLSNGFYMYRTLCWMAFTVPLTLTIHSTIDVNHSQYTIDVNHSARGTEPLSIERILENAFYKTLC